MTATEFSVPLPAADELAPPAAPAVDVGEPPVGAPPARFRLVRSRTDRKLGGVCGGLGATFGIDATLVRVLFVGAGFAGFGLPLYLAAWILAPSE